MQKSPAMPAVVPQPRTTGILIGRWGPDSDFFFGIQESNRRSVGDLAARATMQT
jgi:hypothetical protein